MLLEPASEFEVQMHTKLRDEEWIPSRYEFLKAHKGIRKFCLHGLMSSTGAGKSTLLKCIIAESAMHVTVLVWLSEETRLEYQELINYLDKECLVNIVFVEEKNIPEHFKETQEKFFEYFTQMVEKSGAELTVIDNVTTSAFYNQRFGLHGQNRSAEFLRWFAKNKCTTFYAAHTASYITDNYSKVIAAEDIRGSKELPLMTEYLYIVQKFTTEDKQYNCLHTVKYRHHETARGWYSLRYEQRAYIGDKKVPFNLINQIFKSRDYFGKSLKKKKSDVKKEEKK